MVTAARKYRYMTAMIVNAVLNNVQKATKTQWPLVSCN